MIYDVMLKATTKAAWDAFASSLPKGAVVDEIGPIVITPATYSAEGAELTPAVTDNAWHVNVRVLTDEVEAAAIAAGGQGVTWVDPTTVSSPVRVWAGEMNYWVPA